MRQEERLFRLGSMSIAKSFGPLPNEGKACLIADMEDALSEHVKGGRLICPDAVHVARGAR